MPHTEAAGWRFSYDDRGSGPAVILLHGLLMDRSMWDHQVESLQNAYRVVTFDSPGHGASPLRESGYTLAELASALREAARGLGIERAVWGGHSMGAYTALCLTLEAPETVAALILIDGNPGVENPMMVPQYDAMLSVARETGISEDLANVVGTIFFGEAAQTKDDIRRWVKHFAGLDGRAIEAACRAVFDRPDISSRLSEIEKPVLVIHGSEDFPNPIEIAHTLAAGLNDAELIEVAGAGHTPPVESPSEVSAAIRTFIDRVPTQ